MRSRIVLLFALLTASLSMASPVSATPTPPVLVVNHGTGQCAEVIQGDDCHWCEPLEGWEVVGYSSDAECPDGYEELGFQGMTGDCRAYKSQFCCSDGAHHGDCEDLVINESEQQCAFVEEIRGCTLPLGWVSADDTTRWFGRCPLGNRWVADITCITTRETAAPTVTLRAATTAVATTVEGSPVPAQGSSAEERVRPGIAWGVIIVLGLFLASGWLILHRMRQR